MTSSTGTAAREAFCVQWAGAEAFRGDVVVWAGREAVMATVAAAVAAVVAAAVAAAALVYPIFPSA